MRSSGERTVRTHVRLYIYRDSASVESTRGGSLTLAPIMPWYSILGELWGEHERSRRQYRSQVSVFKPALFTEHSNADKKRRTVADSVANVGESVAYLGVNTRP